MVEDLVLHSLRQVGLIAGAATLIYAALHDVAARTIPNTTCAIVALIGLALRLADGQVIFSLTVGVIVFVCCTLCWLRGWMGGGDVKLLTAAALLVPPVSVGPMILSTTLFGGIVAVIYIVARIIVRRIAPPTRVTRRSFLARVLRAEHWRLLRGAPLPYGSAIAAGTLFTLFPG
jgi:prepilin peptidase CpaA